ncbi:hypothetical protein [Streptomyces sp. NPDC048256]|uniref:hypothetical protein n=1 Tax=Streptomyces sp. NPDC048256 TaxID=3154613 RepID=UPI003403AAB3
MGAALKNAAPLRVVTYMLAIGRKVVAGSTIMALAGGGVVAAASTADAAPPAAPKLVSVTPSTNNIKIGWSRVSGVHNYNISDGTSLRFAPASASTLTWGGLHPNSHKCFRVSAVSDGGERSAWSQTKCATTKAGNKGRGSDEQAAQALKEQCAGLVSHAIYQWIDLRNLATSRVREKITDALDVNKTLGRVAPLVGQIISSQWGYLQSAGKEQAFPTAIKACDKAVDVFINSGRL